jgi:hypothetical protein
MKLKVLSILGILAICMCNTASAEYLINNNGEYLANPNHEKMEIHNNKYAKDPTFAEVIKILKKTTIDENEYSHTYYCTEFAADLHDISENKYKKKCIIVTADSRDGSFKHCFNAYNTKDRGIVYVDVSSGDRIVTIRDGYFNATSIYDPDDVISLDFRNTGIEYEYFW